MCIPAGLGLRLRNVSRCACVCLCQRVFAFYCGYNPLVQHLNDTTTGARGAALSCPDLLVGAPADAVQGSNSTVATSTCATNERWMVLATLAVAGANVVFAFAAPALTQCLFEEDFSS